jgi:hypothetical protein
MEKLTEFLQFGGALIMLFGLLVYLPTVAWIGIWMGLIGFVIDILRS